MGYDKLQMYGEPTRLPPDSVFLHPHWQYHVKHSGTRWSCQCAGVSKKSAPILHVLADSYSSCVDKPIQHLFLTINAILKHKMFDGDATDAYTHSPGDFTTPTIIYIDD